MQLLVSVRDEAEARAAADAGVDFIDLKDPATGALGGLPPQRIAAIVRALRGRAGVGRCSATIGDHPAHERTTILACVAAVAGAGVDDVKVGIFPGPDGGALLHALAHCGARVVPVFIADDGVPLDAVQAALALGRAGTFPALMLDTQAKRDGSLLQRVPATDLRRFVHCVQAAGRLAGLAGALRREDLPALRRLAPDFVGFRSAVCDGHRGGALVPARVAALRDALAEAVPGY